MLGSGPGEWRRAIKTLVEGLDPEVAVLIGREDASGHFPLRLTLEGCRETLRLYEDQAIVLPTDEAARATLRQELKEVIALLHLKAEIIRAVQQAHPNRRVTLEGPLPGPGGEVGVVLKGSAGFPARAVQAQTYGEAVRQLHQQIVKEPLFRP